MSQPAPVGALYGLIAYRLDRYYRDMRHAAHQVRAAARALLDARALHHPDLRARRLHDALAPYLARTRASGLVEDPGWCAPLRARFKPLWSLPLDTDADLLAAADRFLVTVLACLADTRAILDEAVADSLARGERGYSRRPLPLPAEEGPTSPRRIIGGS